MPENLPIKRELPTLADLQGDMDTAFKQDGLNRICYQPPKAEWIKKHPIIRIKGKQLEYIPIERIQFLLTRIFGRWRREIKSVEVAGNSVMAVVRLWVWNPTYLDWDYHDGVGAVPIQLDAEAEAGDVSAMKANAFQIGGGAAVSYALKNAATCLGTIFGMDLNKGDIEFGGSYANFTPPPAASPVAVPAGSNSSDDDLAMDGKFF